jgi:hypothetical protein
MYRGLLSSPRAAKRKHEEVSPSTTPKRREVGSSSPEVPTHGQVASCPEEENKSRKFSSSFPSEGGEQTRCELNNSDEDIDSEGADQQIRTGASDRAGKMPKRRHMCQIKAKYMGAIKIYKAKCEHGRRKDVCKDCGTGYCQHGCQKDVCKDCGAGYCQHGHPKHTCRDCGTGHCEHGRRRGLYKDC